MNLEIAPNIVLAIIATVTAVTVLWFFHWRVKTTAGRSSSKGNQLKQSELPGITRTTVASHPIREMVIRPRYMLDKTVFVLLFVGILVGSMGTVVVLDITGHLH